MWITGFDVPTLSTLYIDKPLKSHTLMQAIARANRISEGKNNGLIVDYIETYTALLDALAIYGSNGSGTGTEGPPEPPVKPNEELVRQLEEALVSTETFLMDEVGFDLEELITSSGLERLAAMEKGVNAVYTTDETKRKFQVLAREIFKKFKALQPNKLLNQFAARKNAINAIYSAIENNVQSADVADIMLRIQAVIDESIENKVAEGNSEMGKVVDLSGLNFELLEKYFLKAQHKNATV
jgi:type I restriction enzyme R subunit